MKTIISSTGKLAAAALCVAASGLASASNVFVFGDSLSDTGGLLAATTGLLPPGYEVPPDPPYPDGRRSNGPVWVDYLSDDFAFASFTNTSVAGAIAGVVDFPLEVAPGVTVPVPIDNLNDLNIFQIQVTESEPPALLPGVVGLQAQVAGFAGPSSDQDIGVIWIGANDFFAAEYGILRSPLDVLDDIQNAALALAGAGLENLVLGNLPDLGKTPAAVFGGSVAELSLVTTLFNDGLDLLALQLGLAGINVEVVDVYTAFNDLLDNAADLGITETLLPCINFVPVQDFVPDCGDPNERVFYDLVHPTSVVHREIADLFAPALASANVPLPGGALLIAGGLLAWSRSRRRGAAAAA